MELTADNVLGVLGLNNKKTEPVHQPAQPRNKDDDYLQPGQPRPKTEIFYQWTAPSRGQRPVIDQRKAKILAIFGVVLGIILLVMGEWWIVVAVISLVFMLYMLTKLPPEVVTYQLTNFGVKFNDTLYEWQSLIQFFYVYTDGVQSVAIDTKNNFPARIFLTVPDEHKQKVTQVLNDYIIMLNEEPTTVIHKAYDSVVNKIDFEGKNVQESPNAKPTNQHQVPDKSDAPDNTVSTG